MKNKSQSEGNKDYLLNKKNMWKTLKASALRGLRTYLDLIVLSMFAWGIIFIVWFIYQMGVTVFGY